MKNKFFILIISLFMVLANFNLPGSFYAFAENEANAAETSNVDTDDTLTEETPVTNDSETADDSVTEDASNNVEANDEKQNAVIDDEWVFDIENKIIVRYIGTKTDIIIPSQLQHEGTNYNVLKIGDTAFSKSEISNLNIESVVIPEGILEIGNYSFKEQNIKTLNIPSSLTKIGNQSFSGNEIETLTFSNESDLISIGDSAFENNNIKVLDLSNLNKLESIGEKSFRNNSIETLKLSKSTTFNTIKDEAFYGNFLSEIDIYENVQNYGNSVFTNNGKFVVINTKNSQSDKLQNNDNVNTQTTSGKFGSIVNPTFFYVKGVDESGNAILSVLKIENNFNEEVSLNNLIFVGNNINVAPPSVSGYIADNLSLSPITQEFINSHNTEDTAYTYVYRRNTDLPILHGLNALRVDVNSDIDFLQGVSATTAHGDEIDKNKIKYLPNSIDTSIAGIHKVTYSVTDSSGNKTSGIRTIIVGDDIMNLETGKGWVMGDFTYEDNKVTGLSQQGVEKLETNRDIVLPTFNPTNIDDFKTITEIADNAFESKELLTVVLPESLTKIGNNAFKDNKLTNVLLGDKIESIGDSAFETNKLVSIDLPSTLTTIKNSAFKNNNLVSVNIPENVVSIEDSAFENNKISSILLSEKLTSIGNSAFLNNKIRNIELPKNLNSIGDSAFKSNELVEVNIPDSVVNAGNSAFEANKIKNVSLGSGLTTLNSSIFKDNKISFIHLPANITSIQSNAFYNNSLADLTIPETVESIGDYAFYGNYLLQNVVFNEGLVSIGDYAFSKIDLKMEEVVFPSTLRSIGNYAFNGDGTNSKITVIKFNDGVESIGNYAFSNLAIQKIENNSEDGKLPESITRLGDGVFSTNSLTVLSIPENIIIVPSYFAYNNRLKTLKLSSNTTEINSYAFASNNFEKLDLSTISPKLEKINEHAFENNYNLKTLNLPNTVTEISDYAFYYNTKLSEVNLGDSLKTIGSSAFYNDYSLRKITFPNTLTSIASSAFQYVKLEEVIIPDSVTNIGSSAFSNNRINKLKLSENLTTIPYDTFSYNELTEVVLPDKITTLENGVFGNNKIRKIVYNDTSALKSIGEYTFYRNQLAEVTLPETVTSIRSNSFQENPGYEKMPGVTRVFIKNSSGEVVNTNIENSNYMIVNSTPITVLSLEQGSNVYIKNPEVVIKKIGETASFVGEANKYYQPASAVATEIEVSETPQEVTLYYVKTPENNPKNIQLDMQFTNPQKQKLGYGLKEDTNRYSYDRNYNEFLIEVKVTDEQVILAEKPYIDINLDNPNIGGFIEENYLDYNNINHYDSFIKLDANYKETLADIRVIKEAPNSRKLRLYFKKGILKPNQSLQLGFRYRANYTVPLNAVVDFSGAVSFGTEESSTPLAITNSDNKLGIRTVRDLPIARKTTSTEYIYLSGQNVLVTFENKEYAADNVVPEIRYIVDLDKRYTTAQYDMKNVNIVDTLPTYEGLNDSGDAIITRSAELDETKSIKWAYTDSTKTKITFTGTAEEKNEIEKYPIYLKYPKILNHSRVSNYVRFDGTLGTKDIKIIDGTLDEATTKFNNKNYENELQIDSSTSVGNYIKINDTDSKSPIGKDGIYNKEAKVYKRTYSHFGYESAFELFKPGPKAQNYSWSYKNSNYDYSSVGYTYSPSESKDSGNWYYYSYQPNTSAYKNEDIVYFIEMIFKNGSGKNIVYKDTSLDSNLQYKEIYIPDEFKSATLKLYTSDNATGEPILTKKIFKDGYLLTSDEKSKARSYSLEFDGEIEGTPFTNTSSKMKNVVEFKNKGENIKFDGSFKFLESKSEISATLFFEKHQDVTSTSTYIEKFAVTNSEDIITNFTKKRVAPACPNPLNIDAECSENEYEELYPGKRISFEYNFDVRGFLNGDYTEFVVYDKLPYGLSFIDFVPNEQFIKLSKGYNIETDIDDTGRAIVKIKSDKIKFSEKAARVPADKKITIGVLNAVANADIRNDSYENKAYLGIKGINSDVYKNIKSSLGSKNDVDLVNVFSSNDYLFTMEGIATYRASLTSRLLGELTEKEDDSNIWSPYNINLKSEENYKYRLRMVNQKDTEEKSYIAYAVLPYNDDVTIVPNQEGNFLPNGTRIEGKDDSGNLHVGEVKLTGPITIVDATKTDSGDDPYYEVMYTFEPRENLREILIDNIVTNESIWLNKDQVNNQWDKVTAFKIVTKKPFIAHGKDEFIVSMKAPINENYLYDNLPIDSEFLKESDKPLNKIVFRFASSLSGVSPTTDYRLSSFTSGNRVEADILSDKVSINITKKGFDPKVSIGQRESETYDDFLNRLENLEGVEFELYMVGIENRDPINSLVKVSDKFTEISSLDSSKLKGDLNTIKDLKIINSPIKVLKNGQLKTVLETNNSGQVKFEGLLKNRDYVLREVKTLPGYDEKIYEKYVFISKEEINSSNAEEINKKVLNSKEFSMEYKPLTASIEFNKVDVLGNPIPFTRFKLVKLSANGEENTEAYSKVALSNDSGFVKFTDMSLGTYKLIETAPRGSLQPIDPIIFTTKYSYSDDEIIIGDKDISDYNYDLQFKDLVVNNKAKLDLYKLGLFDVRAQEKVNSDKLETVKKNEGRPLRDVQLKISTEDGVDIETLTTDGFGKVTFNNLEVNKNYLITEVSSPEGYTALNRQFKVKIDEIGTVYINDSQSTLDYVVYPNIPEVNTNRVDIKKVNTNGDTVIPLQGAEFALYEVLENDKLVEIAKKVTDEFGEVSFTDFGVNEQGEPITKRYKVKELSAPLGYAVIDGEFDISTTENTFVYLNQTIENPLITLQVNKSNKLNNEPLQGAEFTLYEEGILGILIPVMDNGEVVKTISNKDGVAKFNFNKFNTNKIYVVKETKAPEGFVKTDEKFRFDLKGMSKTKTFNGSYEIDVTNTQKLGRLLIYKYDEDTKKDLQGVVFELVNNTTNKKVTITTNESGNAELYNLAYGTYTLTEKQPKEGYVNDVQPITINISKENLNIQQSISNKKIGTSLIIDKYLKTDGIDTTVKLKNAKFVLEKSKVNDNYYTGAVVGFTKEDGSLVFNDLLPGYVYRLQELTPSDTDEQITPSKDIGIDNGYNISDIYWFITPKVQDDGTIKLFYREKGSNIEKELNSALQVENTRKDSEKVTINISKTLNGGTMLENMPAFSVKLKRGISEDSLTDVDNTLAVLTKNENSQTYSYTYNDLPYDVYDSNSSKWIKYIYSVEEVEKGPFTPTITKNNNSTDNNINFDITNNYNINNSIVVTAEKLWINGGNVKPQTWLSLFRKTPNSEEVIVEGSIKEVAEGNGQKTDFTWGNLPETDSDGRIYTYLVHETDQTGNIVAKVDDYIKTENVENNHNTITNTYSSPTNKSVKVIKNWINGPKNHVDVYFKLYRNIAGENPVEVDDSELSDNQKSLLRLSDTERELLWTNLKATDDQAREYTYSVKETDSNGTPINLLGIYNDENNENYKNISYSYSHNPDTDVIYSTEGNLLIASVNNTFVIPKISIKANKIWENGPEIKPETWLTLYRKTNVSNETVVYLDEQKTQKYTINIPSSNLLTNTVEFTNLDLTDKNGNLYSYFVKETNSYGENFTPENYVNNQNMNNRNPMEIINTYVPPKANLTFTKKWVNGKTVRPSVYFKLYRKTDLTEAVSTDILLIPESNLENRLDEEEFNVTFENIDLTNIQGDSYTFFVKEVNDLGEELNLENYDVTVLEGGRKIVNTYKIPDTSIKVKKIWENVGFTNRPKVKFKLFRHLETSDEEEIKVLKSQVEFDDKKLYEDDENSNLDEEIEFIEIPIVDQNEIELTVNELEETDINGNKYMYYVKEYNEQNEIFKESNYIVEVSDKGLTFKNTYVSPTVFTPKKVEIKYTCADDGKEWNESKQVCEINNKSNKYRVPNTSNNVNVITYMLSALISLLVLISIKKLRKKY